MRISRRWFGILVLLSMCGLSSTLSSAPAQDNERPHGLVVVIPPREQRERAELKSLSNPYISGVAVQLNWRDIEPVQGQPDWSKLDELFAAAQSKGKWVHLLIFPGFFAPQWAKEGAQTDTFPIQYGPGAGTVESLAMPWDRVYLNRWFAFLKRVSARYGNSPSFRMIAADGPTSVSAEMTLPNKPTDHKKWMNDGYTVKKYLGAWNEVFRAYASIFPNQCISLSAPGLEVLGPGKKDPGERMRARQEILEMASGILGRRLAIQFSNLHVGRAAADGPDQTEFLINHSGRMITGLQMRCSAEGGSAVMGAAGNPPLALRRCVDKGMQPNSAGRHINYLEIYEPDVVAEEMQPVLQYAASLFSQNESLRRTAGPGRQMQTEESSLSQNQPLEGGRSDFRKRMRRPAFENQ
jgi:hypothetical protein